MIGAKPYNSPCSFRIKLSVNNSEPLTVAPITEFRQTIDALQYYTLTRPDIAFSINPLPTHALSKFNLLDCS